MAEMSCVKAYMCGRSLQRCKPSRQSFNLCIRLLIVLTISSYLNMALREQMQTASLTANRRTRKSGLFLSYLDTSNQEFYTALMQQYSIFFIFKSYYYRSAFRWGRPAVVVRIR